MKDIYIDIPIYKCHLIVLRGGTLKEIHKYIGDVYNEKDEEEMARVLKEHFEQTLSHRIGGAFIWYEREYFVWLPTTSGIPELVHELYHATNYILTDCGVEHDERDEAFAYLLEYLMRETLNAMKKGKTTDKTE